MHTDAIVATEHARRYLQQLCKHFAHKIPAHHTTEAGRISFPAGICNLSAAENRLTLGLDAETAEDLDRLKEVVASHLARFAFRETLDISWS